MNNRRGRLAALVTIAVVSAGCGSDSPSQTSTAATHRDRAVRFAECMRDNGVSGFPDPDASGDLTVDGVLNNSSLDPESAAWKAATAACRDLQPPGFTGHEASPREQRGRLAFAQCMRDAGVKDFPDPTAGEPLINTYRIPSSDRPGGMTALNAAAARCGDALDAAAAGK